MCSAVISGTSCPARPVEDVFARVAAENAEFVLQEDDVGVRLDIRAQNRIVGPFALPDGEADFVGVNARLAIFHGGDENFGIGKGGQRPVGGFGEGGYAAAAGRVVSDQIDR